MPHAALDEATERLLADRWLTLGDPEARSRLVASAQSLVRRLARRFRGYGCAEVDLVQEGNLGLLRAIDRFDTQRHVRLSTYAAWWIRAYMLRFVEHNARLIRGATTAPRLRLFYQLSRTKQRLAAQGAEPSSAAVAEALGVSEHDVAQMEQLRRPQVSLDAPVAGQCTGVRGVDRLADASPSPESAIASAELESRLGGALRSFERTLSGRSLEMFKERIASTSPATLQELSARWGVSRAAARRVEERVARPLRRHLYRELGDTITETLGCL